MRRLFTKLFFKIIKLISYYVLGYEELAIYFIDYEKGEKSNRFYSLEKKSSMIKIGAMVTSDISITIKPDNFKTYMKALNDEYKK